MPKSKGAHTLLFAFAITANMDKRSNDYKKKKGDKAVMIGRYS